VIESLSIGVEIVSFEVERNSRLSTNLSSVHSRLSPFLGLSLFCFESHSVLSLFYVESYSELCPFSVQSILSSVHSVLSPFGVESIRG
jgi:hypothetical protein